MSFLRLTLQQFKGNKMKYVNEQYRQAYKKAEKKSKEMRPLDEDSVSNCCTALFTYPGWPDSDICSKCFEHADLGDNNV